MSWKNRSQKSPNVLAPKRKVGLQSDRQAQWYLAAHMMGPLSVREVSAGDRAQDPADKHGHHL